MNGDGLPGGVDLVWVEKARALQPAIAEAAPRTEAEGKVTSEIMAAMHTAEMFRMCLPRSLGGGEVAPMTVMLCAEVVASADASTAWCLGQGLGCARSAAFVDPAVAAEVWGSPDAILAWGPPAGPCRATAVDGGYWLSGKWRLASGARHATWLGPNCPVFEGDGSPRLDANGRPAQVCLLLPVSSATLDDNWDVIGMRGTGSIGFAVDDVFVPEEFTFVRDSAAHRREQGRPYLIPLTTYYGLVFAGVALGVARTVLDDFYELAAHKTPNHMDTVMAHNPAVQREVARAEALLGSARAYLVEQFTALWDSGPYAEWPLRERAQLRAASTNAVTSARDAVAWAYQSAGSSAIFENNPFERRFRDINTVAQQAQGQPVNLEHAGKALLGVTQEGARL